MAKGDTQIPTATERRMMVRLRRLLLWGVPVLVALVAGTLWLFSGRFVETDDSYVKADKVTISADVTGRVVAVPVKENQFVRKGDVLLEIDPAPYRLAVARGEAELLTMKGVALNLKATWLTKSREVSEARTKLAFAESEYRRMVKLAGEGIVPRMRLDALKHDVDVARDRIAVLESELLEARAQAGIEVDDKAEQHPRYLDALAALDKAKLDLARTSVRAPFDGVASKVPQPGQFAAPGWAGMSLVANDGLWIEANFKETDITYMRPGQPVEVRVDAYPGVMFKGHVDSLAQATGAEFSLLPPQNGSGNWVKIVQRLPVRIHVEPDPEHPLRAGMSALTEVDTGVYRHLPRWLRARFAD